MASSPRSPASTIQIVIPVAALLLVVGSFAWGDLNAVQSVLVVALGGLAAGVAWRQPTSPPASSQSEELEGSSMDAATARRLAAIWDHSPLSLVLLDPNAPDGDIHILDCNETACEMHGYTREELIGQSINILEEVPWTQWRESWLANLRKHKRVEGEGSHRHKDGTIFPTEYFTCLIQVNGREYVIGMDHDSTSRKAAENDLREAKEQAEAADRAKSEFLAVMSHEIRTPMNGIIGFTSLLHDTELTSEQRDWLETIRSSGETLLTLINDILDFSKIESGKMEMDLRPAQLDRTVEEVVGLLWSKANEKQVELLCSVDPDLPTWITTDISRVRQIVLNLVGNAIKFTRTGEIEVHAANHPPLQTGGPPCVSVTVRDTGVGIPADRVHRLFRPFSQADSSTTREYGGTGLGLAISRRLAELLDGTVELVDSSPQGSTFRLVIAAPRCDAPLGALEPGFINEAAVDLAGKRVLVVDDNETNCRILRSQLARWNMEPATFVSGDAALADLDTGNHYDIALLDMMMPGMNGMQLAEALTNRESTKDLPLLLLSSVGHDELRRLGNIELFDAILHKPLRQSGLFDALLDALASGEHQHDPTHHPFDRIERGFASEHPLNIMVAEDNRVNRKLIQQMLERHGYEPHLVENGRDCILAMKERSFDLVLMDCQMPVVDGYDATQQIRQGAAGVEHRDIYIVALTAAAMVGDREKCMAVGMNDYLAKPIRTADLVQILRETSHRVR